MRSYIDQDDSTLFFLATDDEREEQNLKGLFPNRILTNERKSFSRMGNDGLKSAIIDVLCLGLCDEILGSYTSVFSRFAADYQGKPLYIVGQDK